jgi:putative endonuclease
LQAHGLKIEAANWRPTGGALAPFARGEIDLVAREGATLVFVEVRSRHGAPGRAEESVTPAKQRRLVTLAQAYLATYDLPEDAVDWRIDVVALHYGRGAGEPSINWLRGAVEAEE